MFANHDKHTCPRLVALLAAGAIATTFTVGSATAAHADDLDRTSDEVVALIESQEWPNYANGDPDHVDIEAAQMLLVFHGYDSGPQSPVFDDALEEQVRAFQSEPDNDLVETGLLDDETWLLLRERTFEEHYGPGNEGIVVRMIQTVLNEKLDAGLDVDGLYGEATQNAVCGAQVIFEIGEDGLFGHLTFRALIHYDHENNDDSVRDAECSDDVDTEAAKTVDAEAAAEAEAEAEAEESDADAEADGEAPAEDQDDLRLY